MARYLVDDAVQHNEDDNTLELKNFTYSEVERITNNFLRELGKGASAIVYHGHLNDTELAVKKLLPSSKFGLKQFRTEVQLLTRARHENLVKLLGYCDEGSNMLLIYEYMKKGDLKAYLSGKGKGVPLSWKERLQIAIDVAKGLKYLHQSCHPPIFHRDVKPANILLNEKLRAKIADFGCSKSKPAEGESNVSTAIPGTFGYLDPTFPGNENADVYSFGVVLLELISGKSAIINSTEGIHIFDWVDSFTKKGDIKTAAIVDSSLGGDFETNSAKKAIEIAMSCKADLSTGSGRPTMHELSEKLKECLQMAIDHERTSNWEEVESPVSFGASFSDQESLDGKASDREEKKSKKKKFSAAIPKLRKSKKKEPNTMDRMANYLQAVGLKHYTAQEVASIIDSLNLLTGGKYEEAYLGHLDNCTFVAVKKFPGEERGFQDFQTEAEMLSKVNHKNLVTTIGYCYDGSTSMLIYGDVVRSLRDHLSGENRGFFTWKNRIEAARDVAQGLNYLHNDCKQPIIHRNVKSVNILFDKKYRAKLAGFRWSKIVPHEDDHVSTGFCGTKGYYDPEYWSTGKVSVKSDVYSFGIVLLELVSSRSALMKFPNIDAAILLSKWVKSTLDECSGDIGAIVDKEIVRDSDMNSAKMVVKTAMACIRRNPSERPTMSVVASILNSLASPTEGLELDLDSLLGPPVEETGSHPDPLEDGPGYFAPECSYIVSE